MSNQVKARQHAAQLDRASPRQGSIALSGEAMRALPNGALMATHSAAAASAAKGSPQQRFAWKEVKAAENRLKWARRKAKLLLLGIKRNKK